MEEMMEQEVDMSNPRLQAIMDLLKFLSQSEGKRAMPPEEAPMPAPAQESAEGEPTPEELEALKSLAR